ncbi:DNA-methyltransferase [Defluviimonas salinarum]|uniref:Methyltransferase n=1 Tax=Defluviimonas salinarum TaxID=2992147 RepID=A0ABT3J8A7_9RHOB|nr:site-specific DNA-methyltransferase [Defluviimonas salinarum]MCW3783921.1 site-specific DNA-methyltransferase [Defluviimonas salinarum]
MPTEVTIGPCRLILGDALGILPDLCGMADLLATDPPYDLTSGGRATQVMSGIFSQANYDNSGKLMRSVPWREMGGPLFAACKPDADAYIMANDKNVFAAHAAFTGAGWKLHNLLSWKKGAPTRNRWYMKDLEFTLYLWKGRAQTINEPGSKQLFSCPRPADRFHRTQKPVELFEHYIRNSSHPGDLVLDPFSGSATTLVAAMRTGRRAIGIEIDERWFDLSAARLEREWARLQGGDCRTA